jgi:acyl carrier protein
MAAVQVVKMDYSIIEYFSMVNELDSPGKSIYKELILSQFKDELLKALNVEINNKEIVWINNPNTVDSTELEPKAKIQRKQNKNISRDFVKKQVIASILKVINDFTLTEDDMDLNDSLETQFGLDDLDTVEMIMDIEQHINVVISDELGATWMEKEPPINQIIDEIHMIAIS